MIAQHKSSSCNGVVYIAKQCTIDNIPTFPS